MISGSERGVSLCEFGFLSVMRVTDHYERLADEISEDDGTVLPMQGGRSGGVQFDVAGLQPKLLDLFVRQNSFEPERFACERAMVKHLKPSLLVRVGDGYVQWPMVWPLERRSANPLVAYQDNSCQNGFEHFSGRGV